MERKPSWFCACLCTFLFVLADPITLRSAQANQSSCPTSISTGQPACGESSDVGSSAPSVGSTLHVGNPVDVASGNKYQSDIDVKLADSELSFVRHYNSAQSNINIGMGNGWRHSYSVMLSRSTDTQLEIVQSDGRRISFILQESVFRAVNTDDGFIRKLPSGRHVWYLSDGRELLFVGSFLASITFEDEALELLYRDTRLISVTDTTGRSIEFEYAPGVIGLRSYSEAESDVPAGHLAAIVLPDRSRVEYKYDHLQNLVSVQYPRGTIRSSSVHYAYKDKRNKALLTERANALHVPFARWTYDDHERVSSYRSSWNIRADGSGRGLPDLRFKYSQGATAETGVTSVEDRQGRIREYEWLMGEGGDIRHTSELEHQKSEVRLISKRHDESMLEREALIDSIQLLDHLSVIDRDEFGYPELIYYFSSRFTKALKVSTKYSQNGKLLKLVKADESFHESENIDDLDKYELIYTELDNTNINELFMQGLMMEAARALLEEANTTNKVGKYIVSSEFFLGDTISRKKIKSNVTNSTSGSFCSNALLDCTQLQRIMRYAELAECAYKNSNCQTRFVRVNPAQLGLVATDLVEDSFRASVFYDVQNTEYIVTFAGTSALSPGDWNNNVRQEFGWNSFQYEKAIRLARELSFLNPGLSFTYTGHSLGGGLATAAVAAGFGEAVVFNPSGFTSQSASNLSVSHTRAEQHTTIFSVQGEILRLLQVVGALEDPPGTMYTMDAPRGSWTLSNPHPFQVSAALLSASTELHSMDAVIQSISEYLSLNHCPP